jgi:TetR/AcrR family fatty acid metabolism transcriptional regulator
LSVGKVEKTIENIIQATIKVAFAKGFANTRTSDIAKEAGVSEGLIFKYFPTKNHLFATIIKDNIQRIKKGVDVFIETPNLSATEKLENLIDFHFDFFTNQRNMVSLLLGHSERKSIGDIASILEHGLRPYVQLIARILQEGINSGEFRPFDVETISIALLGSMQISLIAKIFLQKTDELEETKIHVKEYILAGIKAFNR